MSTPADTLTRAADRLEELAAKAPSGRWDVQEFPGVPGVILSANYRSMLGYHVAEGGRIPRKGAPVMNRDAAMWIATMPPASAAPLVEWLRSTAELDQDDVTGETYVQHKAAQSFARLVLGEAA